jgi:hypothetical protein
MFYIWQDQTIPVFRVGVRVKIRVSFRVRINILERSEEFPYILTLYCKGKKNCLGCPSNPIFCAIFANKTLWNVQNGFKI